VRRDCLALAGIELAGDRLHRGVVPAPVRIGCQLRLHIAPIQPGEPGRAPAIAQPVDPMAFDAGVCRARIPAAQRDQLAARSEPIGRGPVDGPATHYGKQKNQRGGGEGKAGQ
jgi:hypothetical protein